MNMKLLSKSHVNQAWIAKLLKQRGFWIQEGNDVDDPGDLTDEVCLIYSLIKFDQDCCGIALSVSDEFADPKITEFVTLWPYKEGPNHMLIRVRDKYYRTLSPSGSGFFYAPYLPLD